MRFSYVKYDDEAQKKQQRLKAAFEFVEKELEEAFPVNSRQKERCLTSLEEAYMWTGKATRDEQIARDGDVTEQPARGQG